MPKTKRRESSSGYHFLNLFQCCPLKFFYKYPLGWAPFHTAPHLIEGGAFHEGKAVFYQKGSMDAARRTAERFIRSQASDFEEKDQAQKSIYRVIPMLTQWIYDWGQWDLENLDILEVEKMHSVALPNGFKLTVRPDLVTRRKADGRYLIHETKTTGYSVLVTNLGVYYGDQATSYLWAVSQVHPDWKISGVLPDISYYPKSAADPGKIRNTRGDIVTRSSEQLHQFALGTMNVLSDISQRVKAVASGMDPHAAFPRNTQWCVSYNRPCEYAHVCRRDDLDLRQVPRGFSKDPWAEEHDVLGFKMEVKRGRPGPKKEKTKPVQAAKRSATAPRPGAAGLRTGKSGNAASSDSDTVRRSVGRPGSVRDVPGGVLRSGSVLRKSKTGRKPPVHSQQDGRSGKGGVHSSLRGDPK